MPPRTRSGAAPVDPRGRTHTVPRWTRPPLLRVRGLDPGTIPMAPGSFFYPPAMDAAGSLLQDTFNTKTEPRGLS